MRKCCYKHWNRVVSILFYVFVLCSVFCILYILYILYCALYCFVHNIIPYNNILTIVIIIDDGNDCTYDRCAGGTCVFTDLRPQCDDNNVCTTDVCTGQNPMDLTLATCTNTLNCTTDIASCLRNPCTEWAELGLPAPPCAHLGSCFVIMIVIVIWDMMWRTWHDMVWCDCLIVG